MIFSHLIGKGLRRIIIGAQMGQNRGTPVESDRTKGNLEELDPATQPSRKGSLRVPGRTIFKKRVPGRTAFKKGVPEGSPTAQPSRKGFVKSAKGSLRVQSSKGSPVAQLRK